MLLSKQLQILQALTAQIETVTPDNGYDFDLTGKVFRGRALFGKETVPPFVSILESTKPGIGTDADIEKLFRSTAWPLLIQGWASDDKENPLDPAYDLKASVEQRLSRISAADPRGSGPSYPAEYLLGRLIISIRIGPGICRPPADATPTAFFFLPVTIEYKEDLANPFV